MAGQGGKTANDSGLSMVEEKTMGLKPTYSHKEGQDEQPPKESSILDGAQTSVMIKQMKNVKRIYGAASSSKRKQSMR